MTGSLDLNSAEPAWLLYRDNHLLVVNKPPGLVCHEDCVHQSSLRTQVAAWMEKFMGKQKAFLVPAHRLDRGASGIVVFAKTSKALPRLHASMSSWKKTYHLLTHKIFSSSPQDLMGLWEDYLLKIDHRAIISEAKTLGAKRALLESTLLAQWDHGDRELWLEIILKTGRYHQIRAQASSRGMPIIGDWRYGSKETLSSRHQFYLHALRLEFPHPVREQMLTIQAPYPIDSLSKWKKCFLD